MFFLFISHVGLAETKPPIRRMFFQNSILYRDWANNNVYLIPEYENIETNVEKELIK